MATAKIISYCRSQVITAATKVNIYYPRQVLVTCITWQIDGKQYGYRFRACDGGGGETLLHWPVIGLRHAPVNRLDLFCFDCTTYHPLLTTNTQWPLFLLFWSKFFVEIVKFCFANGKFLENFVQFHTQWPLFFGPEMTPTFFARNLLAISPLFDASVGAPLSLSYVIAPLGSEIRSKSAIS